MDDRLLRKAAAALGSRGGLKNGQTHGKGYFRKLGRKAVLVRWSRADKAKAL